MKLYNMQETINSLYKMRAELLEHNENKIANLEQ